jgi:Flp pilus assembly protein CpaB
MKGTVGLIVAAGLGIAGAICNWFYLERLARHQEQVVFIAIKEDVELDVGDLIESEHLMEVRIPRSSVGNLDKVAPQWSTRTAVAGNRANRRFNGGEIILDSDLQGPAFQPLSDTLQENEVAMWVAIDSRSVVPEQINPGDLVSFQVPRIGAGEPTLEGTAPAPPAGATEILGPFRVLGMGNRREASNIQQANRGRSGSEGTITIVVELVNGEMETEAQRLFDSMRQSGNQGAVVLLHSSRTEE